MPRHRLPGIGEQVPLFVALPSSLPVEGYVHGPVLVQSAGSNFRFQAQVQNPQLQSPGSNSGSQDSGFQDSGFQDSVF
jgi:hypothetical protein